jgi:hypothetical protein
MSDLRLVRDGATPRFPLVDFFGEPLSSSNDSRTFVGQVGEYDVYEYHHKDSSYGALQYVVAAPTAEASTGCYNFTCYNVDAAGNLVPEDDDVELDPYHMCLLYTLHTIHKGD